MYKKIITILLLLFGLGQYGYSQGEDEDDLGTETVNVTKAYTPTISDAFKIKSSPNLNDSIVLQKKKINYSIFSVPVASTFTPAKGQASKVKKVPPPILYNSYASAGGGNPANILAKFYTSRSIDRESGYTIGLEHNSSRADIDGVFLDNQYSNSALEGTYIKRDRDYDWGVNLGVKHQLYNWYGTEDDFFANPPVGLTVVPFDVTQNYFTGEIGANINFEDSYFSGAELQYRRFWDVLKSAENRFVFSPTFSFPVRDELFRLNIKADYVSGSFTNVSLNNTDNLTGINYSNLQVGINPSLTLLRDDLALNLGVNIVYGFDAENSDSNFYIYPAVTASYRLLEEFVIAYGGIEGELKQNSYQGFVKKNPFVSPTLIITPTDQQYDAYLGFKGQLLPNLSYNIKASYTAQNRLPLFKLNALNTFRNDEKAYYLGNSFEVFYDDLKTLGLFGELNVDVNRNFTLGINAEVYGYDTETGNSAWNLPDVKGSLFMDYQIGQKWYAGANLFYVGERQDFSTIAAQNVDAQDFLATVINLDSYFDANAHLGHRLNDRLSIFVKAANIANNNYERWSNFKVQGFQVLAGATYKFDF